MKSGGYYVSVLDRQGNDGTGRLGLLAGPFKTKREAGRWVDKATEAACRVDGRAYWYAFGTCRMKDDYRKPGVLNQVLGLPTQEAA